MFSMSVREHGSVPALPSALAGSAVAFLPVSLAVAGGLVPSVAGDLVEIAGALAITGAVRRFAPFAAR